MSTTDHRSNALLLGSRYISKFLPPALVLAVVVVLAGAKAGLEWWGTALLLLGIAVVPGLIYKRSKGVFRRRGIKDQWRTGLVAFLTLVGAVVCYLIPVPAPVPATVAALFVGNLGLLLSRRGKNVSAHVSVMTFAVLWMVAVFGVFWAWLLLLSPLMLLSRVYLREHTWSEALLGALLGVTTFCCFLVAMNLELN